MPSERSEAVSRPLRLHWSPRSPLVRKVMVAAHELQIAERIECVDTSVNMTRTNAALMRSNPLNKIPILITEDGQVWFDSLRAACCAVMSLLHSVRLNGHDVHAYMKDILERLPTLPASRITELLPHRWTPA